MLITLLDLEREPVRYDTSFPPAGIDFGGEIEQKGPVKAADWSSCSKSTAGPKDIVQDMSSVEPMRAFSRCLAPACLDAVEHNLAGEYDVLYRPLGVDSDVREHSIGASETEIGYYQDGSLLLEDVSARAGSLVSACSDALREDCKGICPRCGANGNNDPCSCEDVPADPRWSALGDLRSRIKIS